MNPHVSSVRVQTRNPILQSLALAILGVALAAALILGAVVFAVLLGVFVVGYLASLAYAWWRLVRIRRRAAYLAAGGEAAPPPRAQADYVEAELEIVEATADTVRRGSGGPA